MTDAYTHIHKDFPCQHNIWIWIWMLEVPNSSKTMWNYCSVWSSPNPEHQRINKTKLVSLFGVVLSLLWAQWQLVFFSKVFIHSAIRETAVTVHQNLAYCSCNYRPTSSTFPQNAKLKWQIWVTGLLKAIICIPPVGIQQTFYPDQGRKLEAVYYYYYYFCFCWDREWRNAS